MDRTVVSTFKNEAILESRLIWSAGNLNFPAETWEPNVMKFPVLFHGNKSHFYPLILLVIFIL